MSLSLYDGVMLAIVLFSVFQGAMKGMAWQLAPIASLVLGYLFAVPLSAATAQWFGEPPLNRAFAMITMYILVSLGVYLIARSLRDSLEKVKLLEFDRHLGALLGGVKGVLFTVVLTVALLSVSPTAASLIVKSESRTIAAQIVNFVCPLLPEDVHRVIDPYLKPIHDHADDREMPFVDTSSEEDTLDVARHEKDAFAPRSRTRTPIFEDELSEDDARNDFSEDAFEPRSSRSPRRRSDDEFDEEEDIAPRRRQRSTDDEDSRDSEPAEDMSPDEFGADPEETLEDERPTRLR